MVSHLVETFVVVSAALVSQTEGALSASGSASFAAEIVSPSTQRKTTDRMMFNSVSAGPTLLDWKAAHDLKLGTAIKGLFRPASSPLFKHKRQSMAIDRYAGYESLFAIGPPSSLKHGGKARALIDVYVFHTDKGFRVSATDSRGKHRTAHLREICVLADARTMSLPQSIAGPDLTARFDAAIVGSGASAAVLWDQKRAARNSRRVPGAADKRAPRRVF